MSETQQKHSISQLYSFIDEVFDRANIAAYQLIFQLGTEGIFITVNEKSKNKYIALEIFTFQNVYSLNDIKEIWDELITKSKLIFNGYKITNCIVVTSTSTLVPEPLYEEGSEKKYLSFNVPVEPNEFVLTDTLKGIDSKNVFAIPFDLKSKLESTFDNIHFCHYSSSLIESLILQNKNERIKRLYFHVQQTHFEILLIEGKKLLLYNTFNYFSPEDFIFYPLFICEQLHLNPSTIEAVFLGEIEKNSSVYALAQKYIKNLKFGNRTDDGDFGFQLQTLPKHFYFTLFNNYHINH